MVADQSGPLAQKFLAPPDLESDAGQTAVIQMTWSLAHREVLLAHPRSRARHASTGSAPTWWSGVIATTCQNVYADEFGRRIKGARVEVLESRPLPHLEQTERTLPSSATSSPAADGGR
jgi:hypothetical protein